MMYYHMNKSWKALVMIGCAIMMFAFTACTDNDDNPVKPTSVSAVIKVNVGAIYDELGIADATKDVLKGDDAYLQGTLLIYDEGGNFVEEVTTTTKTLDPILLKATDLPTGTYTLVAYQFVADTLKVWELQDKQQLSTVKLYKSTYRTEYYRALGLASTTVTFDGGAIEAEVTPKAAGCIIDLRMTRTEEFSEQVSLSIEKHATGIFLDPAMSEADRIEYHPDVDLSAGFLSQEESDSKFFILMEGNMESVFFLWYPQNELFYAKWWDQPLCLKPGTQLVYYFDATPQLFYKTYVGPADGFDAWQQKAAENPYMLEPIVPYGATVDEVKQCMDASSVYHCFRELYEEVNGWGIWYKMNAKNTFYVDFMIDEEKGLNFIYYTYHGDDIPLSAAEDALMKRGYQLIYEGQIDDGRYLYMFEAPDGVDRVEAWEIGRTGWKFVFVDIAEYYEDAKSRRAPMTVIRSKDSHSDRGSLVKTCDVN